jgi:hypothetical protein
VTSTRSNEVTRFLLYESKTPEQVRDSLKERLADVPLDADGQAQTWLTRSEN